MRDAFAEPRYGFCRRAALAKSWIRHVGEVAPAPTGSVANRSWALSTSLPLHVAMVRSVVSVLAHFIGTGSRAQRGVFERLSPDQRFVFERLLPVQWAYGSGGQGAHAGPLVDGRRRCRA